MKVAITSQGKELSSELDMRFGRAKWLIIFDTQTEDFQTHDNNVNMNAPQGAGIQTAQNIVNLGAQALITGNVGPNAFQTLNAANVDIYLSKAATIKQALDLFKEDKLEKVSSPNVQGHWV
jgi:predicted Fe-Mo cluster-binding NifX family protein